MRFIYSFLVLILSFSFINQTSAQVKVRKLPENYLSPVENTSTGISSAQFANTPWVVFSDRTDNKTYSTKDGDNISKILGFLESFYVIDETETRICLAKVAPGNLNNSTLEITNYEDYGWIDKNKMLLWTHCLVSEKSGMSKKAMVLNNVEWASKVKEGDNTDVLKFCKNPNLTTETGDKAQMFQIFYIYKISDDRISMLIGRASRVSDRANPGAEIVGWAPKQRLVFWDHRVAIEPNWLDAAVSDRRSKNIKCVILRDKTEADRFNKTGTYTPENVLWDDDPFNVRRNGDYRRFPFYSKENQNNIVKNGVWGMPFTAEGDVMTLEIQANIDRKLSSMVEKKRNINIVFVIDGTASMMPYFKPIASAVTASINRLSQTKNNIKFGAVVYRDLAEGNYLTERIKLTADYDKVTAWLMSVYSPDKNINDKDDPEAVFFGVRDALRNVNMLDNETNYLILIGDAGNHQRNDNSQVSREELVTLLSAKNVNFMAFQVNNEGSQAYYNFVAQSKDLMLASGFKVWKINETIFKQFGVSAPPKLEKTSAPISELTGSAVAGKIVQSAANNSISPLVLQDQLISFITKAEEDNNKIIEQLNIIKEGKAFQEYNPALVNILAQSGVTQTQLEILKKSRFQFYTIGYTSLEPNGLKYPLYQSVIFITREELGGIVSDISRLLQKKSGSDVRRHLQETFKKLLEDHLGESNAGNFEDKSMEDITNVLFGLPSLSEFLKGVKLSTIIDPTVFTDVNLTYWIGEMEQKLKTLRNIQNTNNYEYSFESNDEYYYWISQQNLP